MQAVQTPSTSSVFSVVSAISSALSGKWSASVRQGSGNPANCAAPRSSHGWSDRLRRLLRQAGQRDREPTLAAATTGFAIDARRQAIGRPIPVRYY